MGRWKKLLKVAMLASSSYDFFHLYSLSSTISTQRLGGHNSTETEHSAESKGVDLVKVKKRGAAQVVISYGLEERVRHVQLRRVQVQPPEQPPRPNERIRTRLVKVDQAGVAALGFLPVPSSLPFMVAENVALKTRWRPDLWLPICKLP